MVNILPSSSYKIYLVLIPLFPSANINNTIHFLASISEFVEYATGVRWYLALISPLNIHIKAMMLYDPISPYSSRSDVKCFLVPWNPSNNISCPLNDTAISNTKAYPAIIYYSLFYPSLDWSHSSNTLIASKRSGTLRSNFLLVTCPIFQTPQREFFKPFQPGRGFI